MPNINITPRAGAKAGKKGRDLLRASIIEKNLVSFKRSDFCFFLILSLGFFVTIPHWSPGKVFSGGPDLARSGFGQI